jgi:SAM-dependent methyltransferase
MKKDSCLRCPSCGARGSICFLSGFWAAQRVRCGFCGHEPRVNSGIPDFAPHLVLKETQFGPAQRLMNSRIFALLYESPLWRPLHTRIGSGISMEEEVEEVLTLSEIERPEVVADLACGTGHYARAFARNDPGALVYAIDISLPMLIQGQKMAWKNGLKTIRFIRGDLHISPFADQTIDHVNCSGALHLFSNLTPIWEEISRILRPGGAFTAMALTTAGGFLGRIQRQMVNRGRVTFFDPDQLANELKGMGLSSFRYIRHGVSLLFCAMKEPMDG